MIQIPRHPSELKPHFLSNNALDCWVDVNSASRKTMNAGHLPQAVTIIGSEERYWQTGVETEFGKRTFSVKAPVDMEVLRVIERFPRSRTMNTTIKNPQTIVIYIDVHTREIGYLDLPTFHSEHQYFGFEYIQTEYRKTIQKGAFFEKDTPFLISPSLKPGGGYGYGTNLVFASMSHPAGSEDGVLLSESACRKLSFDLVETRIASWGQNRFALNLYGDETRVKTFPDIGEKIRPDGLLLALRDHDERLAVCGTGLYDTMMLDMMYDERLYTRAGEGIMMDIIVQHDQRSLPNGMNAQVEKYRELTDRFYEEIMEEYHIQLRSRGGKKLPMTDEFHQLVLEACIQTDYDIGEVVQKLHHKAPIDDWYVEFKIKYRITPGTGYKLTDGSGGKGVGVLVLPDEEMPVNDHGVRADIVMSPESPFNRQNFGGLYEPFFNQVTRDFLTVVREEVRVDIDAVPPPAMLEEQMDKEPQMFDRIWEDLTELYSYLSPAMYDNYTKPEFDSNEMRAVHLHWLMKSPCIHVLSPTDNMTAWRHAVNACMERFPPRITPVTYRDYNGDYVRTDEPVELGHKYFMLLEKISDDWIAVSTAKTQHLGLLGQITSSDKYANPVKTQAVKALSEAENRALLSYCGGEVTADLLDRNGSLPTHRAYIYSILDSNTPTNIQRGVDRRRIPRGNYRPLKMLKHILECNGYILVNTPYVDHDLHRRPDFIDPTREVLDVEAEFSLK